jgi:hypothetical protein
MKVIHSVHPEDFSSYDTKKIERIFIGEFGTAIKLNASILIMTE